MKKKLHVVLIHGTWSSSRRWANQDSEFYGWLQAALTADPADFEMTPIEWSGRNRWRARSEVARQLDEEVCALRRKDGGNTEYLLIGHSHGGNIATEGARRLLKKDEQLPLRGVVCLNTPFLTQEVRASNGYLVPWFFITLLIIFALQFANQLHPSALTALLGSAIQGLAGVEIGPRGVTAGLIVEVGLLGWLTIRGKHMLADRIKHQERWGPRPRVLCLSCADDEAITLLGLGEGIANLPQLLFHPIALVGLILAWAAALWSDGTLQGCGLSQACWNAPLTAAALMMSGWLLVALAGGLAGTLLVVLLFGLSFSLLLETMASRILVSYTPLRPADTHFRAISDLEVKWSPLQSFHSGIYRSRVTVTEIAEWLKQTSGASTAHASAAQ